MSKTQLAKQNDKPAAVIPDHKESVRLQEREQDRKDYASALQTKSTNKKWTSHKDLKKARGL